MGRILKFRVWDPDYEEMVYNVGINLRGEGFWRERDGTIMSVPQDRVMQFTGMRDSKGKDIYEGDIVKGSFGEIGEVKLGEHRDQDYYSQPRTGWYYDVEGDDVYSISPSLHEFDKIEVVGNKWEKN